MEGFDQCSGNISSLYESHLEVALFSFVLGLFAVVIFACEGPYVMAGVCLETTFQSMLIFASSVLCFFVTPKNPADPHM